MLNLLHEIEQWPYALLNSTSTTFLMSLKMGFSNSFCPKAFSKINLASLGPSPRFRGALPSLLPVGALKISFCTKSLSSSMTFGIRTKACFINVWSALSWASRFIITRKCAFKYFSFGWSYWRLDSNFSRLGFWNSGSSYFIKIFSFN